MRAPLARVLSAALLGALLLPRPAVAAPCADLAPQLRDLLQAMSRSAAGADFSGVLTLQRGGDMQIVEVSHSVRDGRENAVLARLTGQDARVHRRGHPVDCVHPGHRLRLGGAAAAGVCGLAEHYRLSVASGERIAGRATLRLRAEARDVYRYSQVFDVDRESALILRARTLAADQRVLEQYQYASLQLHAGAPPPAALEHLAAHPHPDEPVSGPAVLPWRIDWLPAGFAATDAVPPRSPRKSYTDGLASFSVFLELPPRELPAGEGVERLGSTVAYTRGTRLQERPVLITVLGEVPVNTARMVADAVRLQP